MQIRTEGIVIKETPVGENDKYVTILTADIGTVEAYIKGARRKGNSLNASTGVFAYSSFVLFQNKSKYYVDQADINTLFYDIRNDIVRFSVASYFCQVLYEIKPDSDDCREILRLMLNSMHLLANTKKDVRIIKSVFELRCMSLSGYTPDILACKNCGNFDGEIRFYIFDGTVLCERCASELECEGIYAKLTRGVLSAMQHILYSAPEKVFSFTLDEENLLLLSEVCECYLVSQTEKKYTTLEFLKSVIE